jgi:hypothetical protein
MIPQGSSMAYPTNLTENPLSGLSGARYGLFSTEDDLLSGLSGSRISVFGKAKES